jgi:transcriptional regulator with XRE-family HTH domain
MLGPVDDRKVGLIVRALRRRRRLRQVDVAEAAGVSQSTMSRFELGHLDELSLRIVRAILAVVDARVEVEIRWRGGLAERLVDDRHATIGADVVAELGGLGWDLLPEVTFQRYGERGSIDVLATRETDRAACAIEIKSVVHSYEETQRRLDMKGRLVAGIVEERLGWRPRVVGLVLVVEGTTANRDRLRAIGPLVHAGLPATTREVRTWFRAPSGSLRGVWFVRPTRPGGLTRSQGGRDRIRSGTRRGAMAVPSTGRPSGADPSGPMRPGRPSRRS